jgi:hypothetical protein
VGNSKQAKARNRMQALAAKFPRTFPSLIERILLISVVRLYCPFYLILVLPSLFSATAWRRANDASPITRNCH